MENIYTDGTYLDKNPRWHSERSPWKAQKISTILKKNSIEFNSIVDVGCGAGEVLVCLQKEFGNSKKYTGYEISPQGFSIAKEKKNECLKFVNEDLLSNKTEINFDVAMAIDVFEHVEDYISFLKNIKAKARSKIFHIPLDLSVQSVLRSKPIIERRKKVGHIHYFTKDIAFATMQDLGYKIIDWKYTGDTIELPAKSTLSALAKLPRKAAFMLNQNLAVRIMGGWSLLVLAE
jgi:SAM-dependent methyltransferase